MTIPKIIGIILIYPVLWIASTVVISRLIDLNPKDSRGIGYVGFLVFLFSLAMVGAYLLIK